MIAEAFAEMFAHRQHARGWPQGNVSLQDLSAKEQIASNGQQGLSTYAPCYRTFFDDLPRNLPRIKTSRAWHLQAPDQMTESPSKRMRVALNENTFVDAADKFCSGNMIALCDLHSPVDEAEEAMDSPFSDGPYPFGLMNQGASARSTDSTPRTAEQSGNTPRAVGKSTTSLPKAPLRSNSLGELKQHDRNSKVQYVPTIPRTFMEQYFASASFPLVVNACAYTNDGCCLSDSFQFSISQYHHKSSKYPDYRGFRLSFLRRSHPKLLITQYLMQDDGKIRLVCDTRASSLEGFAPEGESPEPLSPPTIPRSRSLPVHLVHGGRSQASHKDSPKADCKPSKVHKVEHRQVRPRKSGCVDYYPSIPRAFVEQNFQDCDFPLYITASAVSTDGSVILERLEFRINRYYFNGSKKPDYRGFKLSQLREKHPRLLIVQYEVLEDRMVKLVCDPEPDVATSARPKVVICPCSTPGDRTPTSSSNSPVSPVGGLEDLPTPVLLKRKADWHFDNAMSTLSDSSIDTATDDDGLMDCTSITLRHAESAIFSASSTDYGLGDFQGQDLSSPYPEPWALHLISGALGTQHSRSQSPASKTEHDSDMAELALMQRPHGASASLLYSSMCYDPDGDCHAMLADPLGGLGEGDDCFSVGGMLDDGSSRELLEEWRNSLPDQDGCVDSAIGSSDVFDSDTMFMTSSFLAD